MYGGKVISNTYVFMFSFSKGVYSFSRFQIVGAVTEKAHLPIFSLVLGTKSCLETDDLRVLERSEKCSRVTKYVGC